MDANKYGGATVTRVWPVKISIQIKKNIALLPITRMKIGWNLMGQLEKRPN